MKRALSPPTRSRCIHPTRDRITDIEDAIMDQSNSINIGFCRSLGVKESFLEEWSHGVVLEGANLAPPSMSRIIQDSLPMQTKRRLNSIA